MHKQLHTHIYMHTHSFSYDIFTAFANILESIRVLGSAYSQATCLSMIVPEADRYVQLSTNQSDKGSGCCTGKGNLTCKTLQGALFSILMYMLPNIASTNKEKCEI